MEKQTEIKDNPGGNVQAAQGPIKNNKRAIVVMVIVIVLAATAVTVVKGFPGKNSQSQGTNILQTITGGAGGSGGSDMGTPPEGMTPPDGDMGAPAPGGAGAGTGTNKNGDTHSGASSGASAGK